MDSQFCYLPLLTISDSDAAAWETYSIQPPLPERVDEEEQDLMGAFLIHFHTNWLDYSKFLICIVKIMHSAQLDYEPAENYKWCPLKYSIIISPIWHI